MRLVLIEWEDSHGDGSWQQIDGKIEDRALVCRSVGWLALDGERAKVVVPHMSIQEPGVPLQGTGILTIPTRAVLSVVDLGPTDHTQPTGKTHQEVLDVAVRAYAREMFLDRLNESYTALRSDEKAWADELAERAEWDITLSDGTPE